MSGQRPVHIEYRVIAVREREPIVRKLLDDLGASEDIVFWDEEKKGCLWNALRCWRDFKNRSPETTHWCVFADDACLVHNFKDIMKIFAGNFPNTIITMGLIRQMTYKDRGENTPYVLLKNHTAQGLMICAPVEIIQGYLDFYEEWFNKPEWANWQNDDSMWRIYALLHNHPVMTSIPHLVYEAQVPSSMRGHKTFPNSDIWQGFDIDIEQFKTDEYIVSKAFTMNMKMDRKNPPIKQLVSKKLKRRNALEKMLRGSGKQ